MCLHFGRTHPTCLAWQQSEGRGDIVCALTSTFAPDILSNAAYIQPIMLDMPQGDVRNGI